MGAQPAAALAERLRMGVDHLHLAQGHAGHDRFVDFEAELGAGLQLGIDEAVQAGGDGALGGVLDRHHAVVGPADLRLPEHIGDGGHRQHGAG